MTESKVSAYPPGEMLARSLASEEVFREKPKRKLKNKSSSNTGKRDSIPPDENHNTAVQEPRVKGKCGQNTQTASRRQGQLKKQAVREQIQVQLQELDDKKEAKNGNTVCQELVNIKKRERRLFWLAATLSQYLHRKKIPRGMRLIPTGLKHLPTHSELADALHRVSDKGAFDLMLLSLEYARKSRDEIMPQISAMEEALKKQVPQELYVQLKNKSDVKMDVFENTLKKILEKKFKRDESDYLADKIYTWKYRKEAKDSGSEGSSFCYSTSDSDDYSNHDHSNSTAHIYSHHTHVKKAKSAKTRRGRKGKNKSK